MAFPVIAFSTLYLHHPYLTTSVWPPLHGHLYAALFSNLAPSKTGLVLVLIFLQVPCHVILMCWRLSPQATSPLEATPDEGVQKIIEVPLFFSRCHVFRSASLSPPTPPLFAPCHIIRSYCLISTYATQGKKEEGSF